MPTAILAARKAVADIGTGEAAGETGSEATGADGIGPVGGGAGDARAGIGEASADMPLAPGSVAVGMLGPIASASIPAKPGSGAFWAARSLAGSAGGRATFCAVGIDTAAASGMVRPPASYDASAGPTVTPLDGAESAHRPAENADAPLPTRRPLPASTPG